MALKTHRAGSVMSSYIQESIRRAAHSGLWCFLSFVTLILIPLFSFICFSVGKEIKLDDAHWVPVEHLLYKVSFS